MIRGLYTSALGMTTQMKKMDVVSNNIANVDTAGFKRDRVVTRSFTEELMKRLDDPNDLNHSTKVGSVSQGVFVDDIYTDFATGSMRATGGTLDLAISGEGFFTIQVPGENGDMTQKYTRDGIFTLDSTRTLMTKTGFKVMGQDGPIVIPDGDIAINDSGAVYSNGQYVDTMKMVSFEDLHTLRKFKDSLYSTTAETKEKPFTAIIEQGYVESSNANSVREMVDMITTSRLYEANQRMITIHDTVLQRTVNDLGRK